MFKREIITLMLIFVTCFSALAVKPDNKSSTKSHTNPVLAAGMQATVVVHFNDPNLEKAIRDALNKPTGDITDADMAQITILSISKKDISDLTGLEYAINMIDLTITNTKILEDLSPIENLIKLEKLCLNANKIKNIFAIQNLNKLKSLRLCSNQISDISVLQSLNQLTSLDLYFNQIKDISALKNLTQLNSLRLSGNQIRDISALQNLNQLTSLELDNNQINDISALKNLNQLNRLNLVNNQISDVSALQNLIQLQTLNLNSNRLNNENLSDFYNLDNLRWKFQNHNQVLLTLHLWDNPGIISGTTVQKLADNLDKVTCEQIQWDGTCGVDPDLAVVSRVWPEQGCRKQKISVQATATNSAGEDIQMKIDWGDGNIVDYGEFKPNAAGFEFFHSYKRHGVYWIKVLSRTRSGAEIGWSKAYKITIKGSNSAPEPQLNSITPNPVELGQKVTLLATATDAEQESVQMRIDWGDGTQSEDSPFQPSGASFSFTYVYTASGRYDIRVMARDNSQLESEWSAPQALTVNTAPAATISSVTPNPAETSQTVTVEATATDPESQQVMLQVDWGDGTVSPFSELKAGGSLFSLEHVYTTAGNYAVKVRPKDEYGLAGEWSAAQTITISRQNIAPVTAIQNLNPNPAETGRQITAQVSARDPENDQVRIQLDWGDGTISDYSTWAASGTSLYFNHTYTAVGDYAVKAIAKDRQHLKGEWSAPQSIKITASNGAPAATISQVTPASAETGRAVTVQATATDPENEAVQMRIDWGDNITDYSALQASGTVFTFTHAFPAAGNYQIRAMSRDTAGLESAWTNKFFVNIHPAGAELVASITEIIPNPASVNQTAIVRATAMDRENRPVQMQIDWGTGSPADYSELKASGTIFEFTNVYSDTGNFAVKVRAKNSAGTESDWSAIQMLAVKSGNLPPQARVVSADPNPAETNQLVSIQFAATDPNNDRVRIKFEWGDGRISDFTGFKPSGAVFEFTPAYPNPGNFQIRVMAEDEAGLAGEWTEFALTVNAPNFAPGAALTSLSPNPAETGQPVTVQISVTDPEADSVQCRLDWGDGQVTGYSASQLSGSGFTFTHIYSTTGSFTPQVRTRDVRENIGVWTVLAELVVLKPNRPPLAYIKSLSPQTTVTGQPVNLVAMAADSNQDRIQLQVNWGDDNISGYSALQSCDKGTNFSHAYTRAGDFSVTVRARDEKGAEGPWSASALVMIKELNQPPTVVIQSESQDTLMVGHDFSIEVQAQDVNSDDRVQVRMDWGDGTISAYSELKPQGSIFTVNWNYPAAGSYRVRVMAKDVAGLESDWSAPLVLTVAYPTAVADDKLPVKEFSLSQNYPNPFNNSSLIQYSLKKAGFVELTIYDTTGKQVKKLIAGNCPAGRHYLTWDGRNDLGALVASGIYLYQLKTNALVFTRKLILIK